ncbi:hypothetical protein DFH06DRAFT_167257 [Mycena polygramma]|nr:hypothetical protein DFH06DRAFT_167257 [Mycena polygramma]
MMQRAGSSSGSSTDGSGEDYKAAQAAQFRKLNGHGTQNQNLSKLKAAQADQYRPPLQRAQSPPRKPRSNSVSVDQYGDRAGQQNLSKFKEAADAQAKGFRPALQRAQSPPKKPRSNSVEQPGVTVTRTRSSAPPTSASQLLHLIGDSKDTSETRGLLQAALEQLNAASAAQQNTAAAQAQAQLGVARLRLEAAEAEIERTQHIVHTLEAQRDDAEHTAAKARTLARKLHTENRALVAREQGRREGYETGFEHGRVIAVTREREERRRVEGQRQRRIAPPPAAAPVTEPQSAFIEEVPEQQPVSRVVSAPAPPPQRRDSARSERQQQRAPSDPAPPPVVEAPPPERPPSVSQRPPVAQRPPSVSSTRRVSAPPPATAAAPPPQPRSRATSVDSRTRPPSVVPTRPPTSNANAHPEAAARPRTSASSSATTLTSQAQAQPPVRRSDSASRRSGSVPAVASGSANAHRHSTQNGQGQRQSVLTQQNAPLHRRTASASTAASDHGLVNALLQRTAPLSSYTAPIPPLATYASSTQQQQPVSVVAPPPIGMNMPEPMVHIPMPRPPPGVVPPMPAMPPPPQQMQFEVEHAGAGPGSGHPPGVTRSDGRDGARSPSSVSTSLRTLRLTSFPVSAGPGSDAGSSHAHGAAQPRERERNLSVILEHGEGSASPGSMLSHGNGNAGGWEAAPPRQQTPWAPRQRSPYTDPRGMEEWRRGTDEEAPRNVPPPPIPMTPGMLSPVGARPNAVNVHQPNMHPQASQQTLRHSESGSSVNSVNITIVPPSRPTSVGQAVPGDAPAEGGFLSPNHMPAVPEDESESDEDTDEDSDEYDAPMPPGTVLGPLPAFAQGVTYPVGFVPMAMTPQAGPVVGGAPGAAPPGFVPTSIAPPPHAGFAGQPMTGAAWGPAPIQGGGQPVSGMGTPRASTMYSAPPLIGATAMDPARPPQMQTGGNPNANSFVVEPARPVSRQGNPSGGWGAQMGGAHSPNAGWAGAPPLTVEPVVRPSSRQMGGIIGNPAASSFTVEPARPLSRQGNPSGGWGAPEPARPTTM